MQALMMYANGLSNVLTKQWPRLHSACTNLVFRISNTDKAVLLNILLDNFLDGCPTVVETPLIILRNVIRYNKATLLLVSDISF
jgi:hypothetical protein